MATGKTQSQISVDVDAEPWTETDQDNTPSTISLSSANVSVDAVPGRRNAAPLRTATGKKVSSDKKESPSEKADMRPLKEPEEDLSHQVRKKIEDDLSSSMDSTYGSYSSQSSNSPDSEKSNQLLSLDDEIKKYEPYMPTEIKAPFIDVLVLYSVEDRAEVENFRLHLIKDIPLPNGSEMTALLYDCPEFTGLSGSQFQHLDLAVERSTYVFVYLTKSFVECKWCDISSESCLMKAIYDDEKRWCVVPVYTQRRNNCKFKIPMGLNSLKGINYYNNDEFYRNGVARLVGDKVHVKDRMAEKHKIRQKKWIEEYKREQAKIKDEQMKKIILEEAITQEFGKQLQENRGIWQQNLPYSMSDSNLSAMHQSSSNNSLKAVQEQHPGVQHYFNQLNQQIQSPQGLQMGQYPASRPAEALPIGNAAHYSHAQHAVQRSTSRSSTVSKDAANSIPQEIMDKIKDLTIEEQNKYIDFFLQQQNQLARQHQSLQQQQQAVLNMPPQPPPMSYLPPRGYQYPPQMMQGQGQPVYHPQQSNSMPSLGMPLTNAPQLSLSLSNQGQQGSLGNHGNQDQQCVTEASRLPNMEALSIHSYSCPSIPGTYRGNSNNAFSSSSSQESYSTGGGYSGAGSQGQSVDGPTSSFRGNIPVSGLFNSHTTTPSMDQASLETDSPAKHQAPDNWDSMQRKEAEINADYDDKDRLDERKGNAAAKAKREKHVHYTINVYSASSVQVGDGNITQGVPGGSPTGSEDESAEGSEDDSNDHGVKTVAKERHQKENVEPEIFADNTPTPPISTAIADGGSTCSNFSRFTDQDPKISGTRSDNIDCKTSYKSSACEKQIGMVHPMVQVSPSPSDDKDNTSRKTVVPSSETAPKTVDNGLDVRASADSDDNNSGDDLINTPIQALTKSVAQVKPAEDNNSAVAVSVAPVTPEQLATQYKFTTNPRDLFYQPRPRRDGQGEPVKLGEDPLSRLSRPNEGTENEIDESAGFSPNGPEALYDHGYDLCRDDYENGDLGESIDSLENSGTSKPKRFFNNFLSHLTNKVSL